MSAPRDALEGAERWKILVGDCRDVLQTLPSECVQCVVTSPPYLGLRDYGVDGQIGLESSPQAFVAALVVVFRELRRVLRRDGTVWLNLGDTYANNGRRGPAGPNSTLNGGRRSQAESRQALVAGGDPMRRTPLGYKPKDLMMLPHRVAIALQDDGWWVRMDVVWSKPSVTPESVRDRPTRSHEYLFLLSRSRRYFYDAVAIAEPVEHPSESTNADVARALSRRRKVTPMRRQGEARVDGVVPTTRNVRSVWSMAARPFKGAHFATFPIDLPERCILAGTSARGACARCGAPLRRAPLSVVPWVRGCRCDTTETVSCVVLDPFAGVATTGLAALRHERRFLGIELNPHYAELARDRLVAAAPLLHVGRVSVAERPELHGPPAPAMVAQ